MNIQFHSDQRLDTNLLPRTEVGADRVYCGAVTPTTASNIVSRDSRFSYLSLYSAGLQKSIQAAAPVCCLRKAIFKVECGGWIQSLAAEGKAPSWRPARTCVPVVETAAQNETSSSVGVICSRGFRLAAATLHHNAINSQVCRCSIAVLSWLWKPPVPRVPLRNPTIVSFRENSWRTYFFAGDLALKKNYVMLL